jgi:hypothetical protein
VQTWGQLRPVIHAQSAAPYLTMARRLDELSSRRPAPGKPPKRISPSASGANSKDSVRIEIHHCAEAMCGSVVWASA